MKVLNARTALLSDYEVLSLLQEMEADQQQGNERSSRIAEGDADDAEKRLVEKMAKVPQNLRTIQYEVRQARGVTRPSVLCVCGCD